MSGLLSEMVSQIATVRSFAGERIVKHRYDSVQEEWWATRIVEQAIEHRAGLLLNLVNTVAIVWIDRYRNERALAGVSASVIFSSS